MSISNSLPCPHQRATPYADEPGFSEESGLWLYGNVKLLQGSLAYIPDILLKGFDEIERETERLVLDGSILVSGIHGPCHQASAIVPLRWGSPRIVVFSGGFHYHLGPELDQEPFRAARLWRYGWDAKTDLAISRRAPNKLPTFANQNPSVDRLIAEIALKTKSGLFGLCDPLSPCI